MVRRSWLGLTVAGMLIAGGVAWAANRPPTQADEPRPSALDEIPEYAVDAPNTPPLITDEGEAVPQDIESNAEAIPPSASEVPAIEEQVLEAEVNEAAENSRCKQYEPGYFISNREGMLRINVWGRVDFRAFNHSSIGINEFLVRRARVNFRGVLDEDWAYFAGAQLEGPTVKLFEAWIEYRRWKSVRFRAGQFKEPFSYEQLLALAWLPFLERSMGPQNLAPARDIGLQMFGAGWDQRLVYAVGIFNGDGPNTDDTNPSKEAAGRLVLTPWYTGCNIWLKNLSVGGSFTTGMMAHSVSGVKFVTEPDTPFLTFASKSGPVVNVFQKGWQQRWGAEVEWLVKWFKMYGEYIWAKRHNLTKTTIVGPRLPPHTTKADMVNSSWYAAALVVLTGEPEVRDGPIAPCRPVGHCGGWGAWEAGFRYDTFHTNEEPFDAGIVTGTRTVDAWTAGLNWYPTVHTRMSANVYRAHFDEDLFFYGRPFSAETAYIIAAQFYY